MTTLKKTTKKKCTICLPCRESKNEDCHYKDNKNMNEMRKMRDLYRKKEDYWKVIQNNKNNGDYTQNDIKNLLEAIKIRKKFNDTYIKKECLSCDNGQKNHLDAVIWLENKLKKIRSEITLGDFFLLKNKKQMKNELKEKKRKETEVRKKLSASKKIQRTFRGTQTRKRLTTKKRNSATIKIQTSMRRSLARKKLKTAKRKISASKKIQKVFRGTQTRKRLTNMKRRNSATKKIQRIERGRQTRKILKKSKERKNKLFSKLKTLISKSRIKNTITSNYLEKIQTKIKENKEKKLLNEIKLNIGFCEELINQSNNRITDLTKLNKIFKNCKHDIVKNKIEEMNLFFTILLNMKFDSMRTLAALKKSKNRIDGGKYNNSDIIKINILQEHFDEYLPESMNHIDDYDALFNAMVKDKNKYKKIKKKKRKKLKENKKEYSKFLEEASEILNIKNTRWG